MIHPFNDENTKQRLLREYHNYDTFIVGVDFDNTIRPLVEGDCSEVIELLRRCSKDSKIVLCLWSMCDKGEVDKKLLYCTQYGINIDYINESPFNPTNMTQKKQYFNILLDDRAGLESAYNNLKYVLDNANN